MEFRKIEVVPISGNIGALINGAQLNALNDETFEEVYQAWLDHCVIFFRDQKITPREQIDFAQRFGEIHFHPYMKGLDDHPEILEIIKEPGDGYTFGSVWHTDQMFNPFSFAYSSPKSIPNIERFYVIKHVSHGL